MLSNFYTTDELNSLGFKSFGKNVKISRKCSIYNAELIKIGDNVRIDDFCILSGNIKIGNYIHIAAYSALYGKYGIEIEDFCGISARGTIYSAIDDFSGSAMISPMVPDEYTNLITGKVVLKKYTQLGYNTVIFPRCILNEGVATGAMTLIKKTVPSWKIVAGIPAKIIGNRKTDIIELSKKI